jgi:hypothetical protein
MNKSTKQYLKSKLPTRWLVIVVFALAAYGLGQPALNRKLGLNLPSLASLLGEKQQERTSPTADSSNPGSAKSSNTPTGPAKSLTADPVAADLEQELAVDSTEGPQAKDPATNIAGNALQNRSAAKSKRQTTGESDRTDTDSEAKSQSSQSAADKSLLYGLLRDMGREDYVSPAGLHYTRGSEEGHRLKHLERHLRDQPDRPGNHGVFNGDISLVLRWIDEAYLRAKRKAKGTTGREEDGRTIYEVNFAQQIGYIGGREGARRNHPEAKRLRMVLEGNRVITAFPF